MPWNKRFSYLMALVTALILFSNIPMIAAAPHKILVIMSYEEENPWCIQIKKGIDSVLAGNSDIKYMYLDTKKDFNHSADKVR